jgi:hydroxymethylglutaryl-CoA reductase (NADPH)
MSFGSREPGIDHDPHPLPAGLPPPQRPPKAADEPLKNTEPAARPKPIETEIEGGAHEASANLRALINEASEAYGDDVFVRIKGPTEWRTLSFRDLERRALSLQGGLREVGVRPGSRVAIIAENSPEWVVTFFAVTTMGATAVPMDPKLTVEEFSNLFGNCEPQAIFASGPALEKIEKAAASLAFSGKIFALDGGEKGWERLLREGTVPNPVRLRADDCAVIIYTSGTTGRPKGVMLTQGNLAAAGKTVGAFVPIRRTERILMALPLFHIYALGAFLGTLAHGSRVTFQNRLKGPDILEALRNDSCTMIASVPRVYEMFYRGIVEQTDHGSAWKRASFRILRKLSRPIAFLFGRKAVRRLFSPLHEKFGGHLTYLISGGGRLDPEVGRLFSDVGFVIQEGYGLTETAGAVAVNRSHQPRIGTVGEVITGAEMIIDEPGADGVGEVLLKGPTVFKGYYGHDELTLEAFNKKGWFKTGDLGFADSDGYLTLTGRKKDMIVLASGKNVYPDEIEIAYGASPYFQQIGILGADRGRGEEVFAFIVPKLGAFSAEERNDPSLIEARIRAELARISETLSPHKRITQYRVVSEELPCTQIGKVKRAELRKRLETLGNSKKPPEAGQEDSLTEHVIGIIRRCISGHVPETIASSSHLELDLGMDSLSRTELVTALEKAFRISVPDDEILSVQTVGDIVQILRRHTITDVPPSVEAAIENELNAHSNIPDRLDFSKHGQETRLRWIREKTGAGLTQIAHTGVDPSTLRGNIEHFIGMAQVPVGLAGPVLIDGDSAQGTFYVPLATTEGALVASVTRGMMAITDSGGVRARVLDDQVIRAPTWIFERGRQAETFIDWLKANFQSIKAVAEFTTRSGKLKELEYIPNGRRVTVRFLYTSGDAAGQNMVTKATHAACEFINKEQPAKGLVRHFLENNLSGDKKLAMVNILSTRGKKVYADAVIKKDILRHFLHTTPEDLAAFAKEGALGSMQAGIHGANAQYANVLAAIFIATGQDVACTHEAATGLTVVDLTPEGDLYISVTLPNLIIATVGGGTGKGTQRECLEILGCAGSGQVNRLAEIIAASVLAGEISIAGAHAAGDFAQAHEKLGRNRPDQEKKA